jgi:hypothetical protein
MAKFEGPSLYEQQELADNRRLRRQHALFIPKFLHEAARSPDLYGEALGHLFERSITELEKLRGGGLFTLMGAAGGLALK